MEEDEVEMEKKRIIEKCKEESYQTEDNPNERNFGWGTKLLNFKDTLKINLINFNSNFTPQISSIHIFYKIYNPLTKKGIQSYNNEIGKLLIITYRSNYKKQINPNTKEEYTSDCGWGCMIRSSQMIMARLIYKIFKYKYKNQLNSMNILKSIIPFFMDNNIYVKDIKNTSEYNFVKITINNYYKKLEQFLEEEKKIKGDNLSIISFDPPFSIHKICRIGEIYGRSCGEWFSDYNLPMIFSKINNTFDIIPDLNIFHFNSDLAMNEVLAECFTKIKNIDNSMSQNDYFQNEKMEKFLFKKMGAIFISVRLGLLSIPSEYYPSIKKLFECKQFIGIIGGKMNSASYFFGYCDDDMLYLDPHFNQESITKLDMKNISSYLDKKVYKLHITNLQCAFTIGFLFRNLNEFKTLYCFMKMIILDKFPCFHVHFEKYYIDKQKIQIAVDNEKNDF